MNASEETIGDAELSAWRVAPGACWVQTRSPRHARRLAQRQDSRLVAWGVAGSYLRTFELHHSLAWARRLVCRYTENGKATGAAFSASALPAGTPEHRDRVRAAGECAGPSAAAKSIAARQGLASHRSAEIESHDDTLAHGETAQ